MEFLIETERLTKRYGPVLAVEDLSLRVPRGGIFGLLGPNGSGKTTAIGMVLGLVRPTAGRVRLFGRDAARNLEGALRRIGAIVEVPAFYPYLSGRDNLLYFQGVSGRGSPDEIEELLALVGLAGRADSKYHTYSLGMKQRLGIAYALLGDPELLFLDEPTNGLDPKGMAEVRDLIRKLGTGERTVLMSSHLLHEVEQVCDNVAILSRGRLVIQGEVHELLQQRGHLRLRTTDDERARVLLDNLSFVEAVQRREDHLVVAAAPQRASEVAAALAASGIYPHELTPVRLSLEEYFLEVTRDTRTTAKGAS